MRDQGRSLQSGWGKVRIRRAPIETWGILKKGSRASRNNFIKDLSETGKKRGKVKAGDLLFTLGGRKRPLAQKFRSLWGGFSR